MTRREPYLKPKLLTVLGEGYGWDDFRHDALAGLTVAIVALPLAMALAIASGATPDKGLITAIVAGFIISALGGSRLQIGGPTGAFVVVVFGIIAVHGYDGLIVATLMAGVILIVAALCRLGDWIKYIPSPVVIGFTAGIAVIIAASQISDALGLTLAKAPADFIEKLIALWRVRATLSPMACAVTGTSLAAIFALRRFAPRAPAFLIVVVAASLTVVGLHLALTTIGGRFGVLASSLPMPRLPSASWGEIRDLVPAAFTIAFLAGIESLLSAMVADSMSGRRHRSNAELLGQGVANLASALFGGLPATGAIARTATSIRAGARSPMAGILHAAFLLAFMMLLGPLMRYVPLASLAAVLIAVAWNMSEKAQFAGLMRGPIGDRVVLLATFGLTVLVDLPTAIAAGVIMSAMRFVHQVAEAVAVRRDNQPGGAVTVTVVGPLFFGVSHKLSDALTPAPAGAVVIDLSLAPIIDASAGVMLAEFAAKSRAIGRPLRLIGAQDQVAKVLIRQGVLRGFEPGPSGVDRFDWVLSPAA